MRHAKAGLLLTAVMLAVLAVPLAAFDRDLNMPSQNVSDPIWMYELNNGDDVGWDEPVQSPSIIPDDGFSILTAEIDIFIKRYGPPVNLMEEIQPVVTGTMNISPPQEK